MEKFCLLFCAHQRPICFFYHTPRQLPPHDTAHCVKTVTLGWVGAPNKRTPFRINDAFVCFLSIDVCQGLEMSPF